MTEDDAIEHPVDEPGRRLPRVWLPVLAVVLVAGVMAVTRGQLAGAPTTLPLSAPPTSVAGGQVARPWTSFTNEELGYSVSLPPGWSISSRPSFQPDGSDLVHPLFVAASGTPGTLDPACPQVPASAISGIDSQGAVVWISEWKPVFPTEFDWTDVAGPPADCATDVTGDVQQARWTAGDRGFVATAFYGVDASFRTRREAYEVVASFATSVGTARSYATAADHLMVVGDDGVLWDLGDGTGSPLRRQDGILDAVARGEDLFARTSDRLMTISATGTVSEVRDLPDQAEFPATRLTDMGITPRPVLLIPTASDPPAVTFQTYTWDGSSPVATGPVLDDCGIPAPITDPTVDDRYSVWCTSGYLASVDGSTSTRFDVAVDQGQALAVGQAGSYLVTGDGSVLKVFPGSPDAPALVFRFDTALGTPVAAAVDPSASPGDVLYLSVSNGTVDDAGRLVADRLVAFDAFTGETLWITISPVSLDSLAVAGSGAVYGFGPVGSLVRFDPASGAASVVLNTVALGPGRLLAVP